jgi:hypothetical protein
MEKTNPERCSITLLSKVVLPAPEGAEMTNNLPEVIPAPKISIFAGQGIQPDYGQVVEPASSD